MAGIATGERLSGEVVQAIIAAASLGNTIRHCARLARCDHTVAKAVINRESATINQRKQDLQPIFARIAQRGAERIERDIDTAPFTGAVIATGVAVDKLIALTPSDAPASQHLHLHLNPQDIAGTFNSFLHSLQAKARQVDDSQPTVVIDANASPDPS